nr:FAD-dependent oxidoreductase [Nitrospinaceae bacterium]NIR55112.1 FAD-dependent oxidoreductase [Nitrospinaceae bacterium]NIS85527.1 FAD-dependent oxidoreductase [Nitrospinaceae bacterium]NIT82361.1 FAD-dependent oxidoreductase [Nitrospinaceae bacterium]NIU44577.1 FAD-dependent oxidoreductase [Nitrospinaceae bacterium]
MDFDVIVIGGGSGGYAAADAARSAGARVAIFDPGPLGGLCILRGCMPTKTLLRSSDVLSLMKRAREFGLLAESVKADLTAVIERKNRLIREFADYRIEQLKNPRFTLIEEKAAFVSPNEITAGGTTYSAKAFIIATGSVIKKIPIPGLEETGYLTSDDVLELKDQPESMIVLGAGPVGVELAQFYQRLGTSVTLIQRSPHILSSSDEDMARPVESRFREEGMTVFTGTKLQKVSSEGDQKTVHFLHEGRDRSVSAEVILDALGRSPNTEGLNLEAAGVDLKEWGIRVDTAMRTSRPHIFAVGDVNGLHEIVHIAIQQGEIAGWNAAHPGQPPREMDERLTTHVVFTDPQVARVGLTEKECRERKIDYLAASYPFDDH